MLPGAKSTLTGLILLAALLLAGLPAPARPGPPQVVIIASYQPGDVWTDQELAGLLGTLRRAYPELVPGIESLDAKHFPSPTHLAFYREYLAAKYRGRRVDLVIALDNPALELLRGHRGRLFPGAPVVFAGINDFTPDMLEGETAITGVSENLDPAGTLELALALHPRSRSVLAVHDYTATGLAVRRELEAALPRFEGRVAIRFNPEEPVADLLVKLAALPPDALVLILSYVTDGAGQAFSRAESTQLISRASPVPAYAMHEFRLGHGIVGGILLSGPDHGEQVAEVALKVLAGEDAGTIPVAASRSRPMFDHAALARFGIDEERLPPGSVVINRPVSLYGQYRRLVLTALVVIGLLTVLVAWLLFALARAGRAEAALRESQERYRQLFQTNQAVKLVVDPEDGAVVDANQAACQYYGYPRARLIGMKIHAINPDAPTETAARMALVKAGKENFFRFRHRLASGEIRDVDVYSGPLTIQGRTLLHSIVFDVTERERAQEALRRSEEKFAKAFQASPVWVSISTLDEGRFLEVNDAFTALTGYGREEALGRTPEELGLCPEPPRAWARAREVFRREGRFHNLEVAMRFRDGREHHLLWSAEAIESEGRPCFLNVLVDVTAQKLAQQEKAKLESQLRQAQKMEAIGTLAGGIAHDFNNILGAVMGYAELAQEAIREGRSNLGELARVLQAATRARDLVRQILTFSRKAEVAPKPLNLNQVVRQALALLQPSLPKMIALETHLASDLEPINADATQLEQVLLNLASNAADAMPEGGRLVVETANATLDADYGRQHPEVTPGRYVLLQVTDTGHGLDRATVEHIFDPFFTTKEVGKGTGLGLATVYGIVKGHGGQVFCYSEPGLGATFKVLLPAHADAVPAPAGEAEPVVPALRGSETILLADDEPALRELGSCVLSRAGYRVFAVASGEEALARFAAEEGRVDLVVLDLGMPGMGGHRCLLELLARAPGSKVVIASGYAANGPVRASLEAGAAGYVAKPFRRAELLATVRSVLDRA